MAEIVWFDWMQIVAVLPALYRSAFTLQLGRDRQHVQVFPVL
jgi:hypothetical protein